MKREDVVHGFIAQLKKRKGFKQTDIAAGMERTPSAMSKAIGKNGAIPDSMYKDFIEYFLRSDFTDVSREFMQDYFKKANSAQRTRIRPCMKKGDVSGFWEFVLGEEHDIIATAEDNGYVQAELEGLLEILRGKIAENLKRYPFYQFEECEEIWNLQVLSKYNLKDKCFCFNFLKKEDALKRDDHDMKYLVYTIIDYRPLNQMNIIKEEISDIKIALIDKELCFMKTPILVFTRYEIAEEDRIALLKQEIYVVVIPYADTADVKLGQNVFFDITDYHGDQLSAEDVIKQNQYAQLIMRELFKYFFIFLKNIKYTKKSYLKGYIEKFYEHWGYSYATSQSITFEIERIKELLGEIREEKESSGKIKVVELGCAMACYSQQLNEYADDIYAVDNSNKVIQMLREVKVDAMQSGSEEASRCWRNINFSTCGINYDQFAEPKEIMNADLIILGMGQGSMIDNLDGYLKNVKKYLRPGGKLFLSFLNRESLVYRQGHQHTNLDFVADYGFDSILYRMEQDLFYRFFGKAYELEEVEGVVEAEYSIAKKYLYPTLISVMTKILRVPDIQDYVRGIDEDYATEAKSGERYGHYITIIAENQ